MSGQTSLDALRAHDLCIRQPRQGYRFSLDALLLADFARLPDQSHVADLGTGCGVIPLLLARKHLDACFVGMENNPDMASLATENVRANILEARITIIAADILTLRSRYPVSSFDVVISNPPFRSSASGKVSPHAGRDAARHETTAGLSDFLAMAKYLVKPSGRIFFIYPPARLAEFIRAAGELNLGLLRLRMVHGTTGAEAKIFLVELAKGRRDNLAIEPPLVMYDAQGGYTAEALVIIA
jgi:tRNA1Val (adenine37-N6)-methyltransferase